MMIEWGNTAPIDYVTGEDGEISLVTHDHIEQTRTTTLIPADWSMGETLRHLTDARGPINSKSANPPAWIECDDPEMEQRLQAFFGVGSRPDDWEDVIHEKQ